MTSTPARHLYRPAILTYLGLRLSVWVLVIIRGLINHHGYTTQLTTWDSAWYLQAVYWGYPAHLVWVGGHVTGTDLAFFPLLPFAIHWLSDLTFVSPSVTGLLISGLSGLTATLAVGSLAREFAGDQVARRSALLFAVFPGTFVFSFIYCEGLLITFAALALLALLRRQWWSAGLLGLLATLTSPAALPLCLAALVGAVLAIRERREWRSLVSVVLTPLGFVGWWLYLWWHTHVFNAWQLTERDGWHSDPSLRYPFHIIANFLFDPLRPDLTDHMLFWGTVIAAVGLFYCWRQRQPLVVLTFVTTSVALAALSAPIGLRPRFLTITFPLAIGFAARFSGWRYRIVVALSVVFLFMMTYESLYSWAVFP
jgi:hypothetical protein